MVVDIHYALITLQIGFYHNLCVLSLMRRLAAEGYCKVLVTFNTSAIVDTWIILCDSVCPFNVMCGTALRGSHPKTILHSNISNL